MGVNIRGRHFLKLLDFSTEEIEYLLDLSANFKRMKHADQIGRASCRERV